MGNLGSVIRVSAGGRDRLNAMYMVDGYGENNPIVVKSEFIMSLIEQIDKKGVGPQHKSIIDRCITNVYRNAAEDGTVPTLCIEEYNRIMKAADKVVYTSQDYYNGCMHKRNRHLVDNSSRCICFLTEKTGGTFYTVNYASEHGLMIINTAK